MKPAIVLHSGGLCQRISRDHAARALRQARADGYSAAYSTRSRIARVETMHGDWQLEHERRVAVVGVRRTVARSLPGIAAVLVSVIFAAQLVYGWSL
jgi:hypothetical protein